MILANSNSKAFQCHIFEMLSKLFLAILSLSTLNIKNKAFKLTITILRIEKNISLSLQKPKN